MTPSRFRIGSIALVFVPALIAAPAALAADAAGTLASLRAYFAETRDLSARFTQTTTLKAVEMEQTASGTVALKKGG
ncbi:MAG TPA: hypothetical protein VIU40_09700, partial [Geobacteraceae bacterium]